MKRDMDLVREILLRLEEMPMELGDALVVTPADLAKVISEYDITQINYHMELVHAAGFINDGGSSGPAFGFIFCGLSWNGHEFLDSIRDPAIWKATKEEATKVGGFSVDLLGALAKGLIKKQIEKHTGISLEF